jgi:hypothetical protein
MTLGQRDTINIERLRKVYPAPGGTGNVIATIVQSITVMHYALTHMHVTQPIKWV